MDVVDFEQRGMKEEPFAEHFAVEMHRLIAHSPLIEELTLSEVKQLGEHLKIFRAPMGTMIIDEGEIGDFMIVVISGSIDVQRKDRAGLPSRIAVVQAGHALGEMSMLDGEPRFASCVTVESTSFAVLTRQSLSELIRVKPGLGAKILVKLVHILSQRLRNTSTKLVGFMEAHRAVS